jgi:hypothetical protein
MFARLVGGILLATLALTPASARDPARSKVTVVFYHALPNVPAYSTEASSCGIKQRHLSCGIKE